MSNKNYGDGFNISPNSNADINPLPQAVYVGVTGTLIVQSMSGQILTFQNFAQGTVLELPVRRVLAGTTATGLIGLTT